MTLSCSEGDKLCKSGVVLVVKDIWKLIHIMLFHRATLRESANQTMKQTDRNTKRFIETRRIRDLKRPQNYKLFNPMFLPVRPFLWPVDAPESFHKSRCLAWPVPFLAQHCSAALLPSSWGQTIVQCPATNYNLHFSVHWTTGSDTLLSKNQPTTQDAVADAFWCNFSTRCKPMTRFRMG